MSYKNWRNQEVNDRLMNSWGYKAPKAEVLTESAEIEEDVVEESEEIEEGIGDKIKGAVKGASKLAGKVGGGLAGAAGGALTLNPLNVAAGALGGQKLGGMAAEKAADLVVNEDGEELEENSELGLSKVDEAMVRRTIREAITKALGRRSEG